MENDVNYATLVFSGSSPPVTKDAETENVVYTEVKRTKEETPKNIPATTEDISAVCEDAASPKYTSYKQATAALGLLCILLLAGLITLCVLYIKYVSKYTSILALYTNESMTNKILQADKAALEKEKEDLTAQRDQFESTLRFIIQFENFPVREYCTLTNNEVHCEPCKMNWIQNGTSCYFFWMDPAPWLTWGESQTRCTENKGHLVVIDTIEEQEFITQHISFYYDQYHGYWIGLSKNNNTWIWITGAALENAGYWTATPTPTDLRDCVLSKPISNLKNWEANKCRMLNRYICEVKVLVWPSQNETATTLQNL
ncbi:asialoglycoprotein receptor 2 [Hemibagrus wyckioides]|uniref:asialoglycoprotein receptor 2 n=1 Tax=Hemibagrus wyckioides TaxID=337641 RepID=UPI00266C05AF|nr:asialoglycoprotein receptor 2 [Hemibagrus wyckioides]